jgi:hypothetical protein
MIKSKWGLYYVMGFQSKYPYLGVVNVRVGCRRLLLRSPVVIIMVTFDVC